MKNKKRGPAGKTKPRAPDAPMRFKILQDKPMQQHYRILHPPADPLASIKGWLARQNVW